MAASYHSAHQLEQQPIHQPAILDGTQIVSKITAFIQTQTPNAQLFPWVALNIAYCPFMHRNAHLTLPELEQAKINRMMEIGNMENGIRYRFLHTLYNDLYVIKVKGFDVWETEMLERIKNPKWISDMYMLAESFRIEVVKPLSQMTEPLTTQLLLAPQPGDMFNSKYLYGLMKNFIENNKHRAPLFPWLALGIVYCYFLYKYGHQTLEQLEESQFECLLYISTLNTNTSLNNVYVVTMFEDLKLIRRTGFQNFESVLLARITQPEWDSSWLYDLYTFAEVYCKTNTKMADACSKIVGKHSILAS